MRAKGNDTATQPSHQAVTATIRVEPHYGIWFTNRRLLEPIANTPPAEAEAEYYAAVETEAMAAELKPNALHQTRRSLVR